MNKMSPVPAFRRSRASVAVLLAYLLLFMPLVPVSAQSVKVKRTTVPQGGAPQGKGKVVGGDKQVITPTATAAVAITATKVDSYPSSPNPAQPGETITYTVTITNNGTTDATGVVFNDTFDANTTFVPNSTNVQPIASADTYNVIGNVRIAPNVAQGVLANDCDPDPAGGACTNAPLTVSGNTSPANGQATVNPDGSFTYNPNPGFTGTDSFTYTVRNTGADGTPGNADDKTDTGTVTLEVGLAAHDKLVWFINPAAAAGGDGRLTAPFNCFVGTNSAGQTCFSATAADDPGDAIFLFSGNHTGGYALFANQKLIGAGATAALASITGITVPAYSDALPSTGGASPLITTTIPATSALTVSAGGILLRGFTVGNTTGAKILGSAFGTLTVGDSVSPDVTLNGAGQALNLTNGTFAATSGFNGVTTTSSTFTGITLSNVAVAGAGTVAFGGTSVSGALAQGIFVNQSTASINFGNTTVTGGTDGVSLQNNSAGTRTFGTLGVSGGSGIAFQHSLAGGNVTVSGAATLASNGNPVDIQNAAAAAISFAGGATATKTSAGGAGVNLVASSVTFESLGITTSNGPGLSATTSGTVAVTNATKAISATGSAGQAAPAIIANAVTLNANFSGVSSTNSGNSGNGVSLTNVSGTSNFGTGAISGAAGDAFLVSGGNASVTYNGTISTSTARPVNVASKTGGTMAFGGAISSTANGVSLTTNTGATINFTGGLNLSTAANTAFAATGGGTVNVTQNNTSIVNTLTTTTGTALNVTSTTIGASGLTFRSINSPTSSANNGVILDTTGTSGGLTVTGNGGTCTSAATCTGGTISNKTGANGSTTQGSGIFLNNTAGVSLDRMQLNDFQNYAIFGSSVTGFSLTNSNINGVNGNNNAGTVEETCIRFNNLFTSASFPTAQINNNSIGGGATENIRVMQTSGTLNRLNVLNNAFGLISASLGNDNFHMESTGTGTVANVTLTGNTFAGTRADFIETIANGNSTMDSVVRQNKFNDGQAIIPGGGTSVSIRGDSLGTAATVTFDISCNRLNAGTANSYDTVGMFVAKGNGGGTFVGTIVNNIIGPAKAGSNADGMFVRAAGSNTMSVLIQNNTITGYTSAGFHLQNNDGSVTMNATIFGNAVTPSGTGVGVGFPFAGLFLDNGATATDTTQMNVVVGSVANAAQKNNFSTGDPGNFSDISINNNIASSTLRLSRNGSASGTVAGVLQDNNLNPATTSVSAAGTITLVNTLPTVPATPAACSAPAAPFTTTEELLPPPQSVSVASSTSQPSAPPVNDITAAPFVSMPQAAKPAKAESHLAAAPQAGAVEAEQPPVSKTEGGGKQTAKNSVRVNATAGNLVAITIGTLKSLDSVTITFQVTINDPLPAGVTQVSNQGTVSGSNFANVLTDDPDVAGAANPTVTLIATPPVISIHNAKAAEPTSGTRSMLFTVSLDHPSGSSVSVHYATADQAPGAGHAVGGAACGDPGADYQTSSNTLTFTAGQTVQTIAVPVCSDADTSETDETFLVNLDTPVGGTIGTPSATGTITVANPPGTVLISELRTSGPGGAGDDFVELYNNTASPITVASSDGSAGWGLYKSGTGCAAAPVLVATITNGTTIPARGHYLIVGSQYSLANYGGVGRAANDKLLTSDLESDANVALFSTANPLNVSSENRFDGVGFAANTGNNCDLLREGTPLQNALGSLAEHSFFRNMLTGFPQDTNDNAADFQIVSTTPAVAVGSNSAPSLGAPGPENKTSPVLRTSQIASGLLDPCATSAQAPNRARDLTSDPANNSTAGTLTIRRQFTNNTGGNVTRLRFRIVDVTTFPAPGVADLRARSSVLSNVAISAACGGGTVPVQGLTLETPPAQAKGGGYNSTLSAGTIDVGTPLAPGGTINVQFLLGLETTGTFRFLVIVEALP